MTKTVQEKQVASAWEVRSCWPQEGVLMEGGKSLLCSERSGRKGTLSGKLSLVPVSKGNVLQCPQPSQK